LNFLSQALKQAITICFSIVLDGVLYWMIELLS
jgi:hypothetical protein